MTTTSLPDQAAAPLPAAHALTYAEPLAYGQPVTNGQLPTSVFHHMEPTEIGVVDLESGVLPHRPSAGPVPDAPPYRDALLLVRLHGEPLRIIDVPRPLAGFSTPELAAAIWQRCADAIADHARRCGCMPVPRRPESLEHLGRDCAANEAAPAASGVAIIVPTGGRTEQVARMLESMLSNIADLPEVIIVDNRPGVGETAEVVASFARRNSRIRYVAEARPGSSVARNRGLAETDAEIVVFTDDDVVVDPGWLRWLLVPFARAEVGAVTGMVLPLCLDVAAQKHFEQYAGFSKGVQAREYDLEGKRAADRLLYPYWGGVFGSGNSMAFRRRELIAAGGFDPALGAGSVALAGADIEAMSATVLRGRVLAYEPRSVCWHEHRRSDEALARQLFNYGVGFTAILTKALFTDRRFAASVARSLPVAMRLRRRRAACGELPAALPPHLVKLQREGMLRGPWLYLKSRRWARRLDLDAVIAGN